MCHVAFYLFFTGFQVEICNSSDLIYFCLVAFRPHFYLSSMNRNNNEKQLSKNYVDLYVFCLSEINKIVSFIKD